MKFSKTKFLIPGLAVVLAVAASAFTTNDTVDESFVQNYINSPAPCQKVDEQCTPQGTQECTTENDEYVFAKNGTSCTTPLYRQ
ncbi:DUF6520 family protein [Flagellimonas marinaquae]|uniref:DUF6520 family protein n=1 Tax=Flagellimonas aurea TaxID=2915619 RepID=UPI001CE1A7F2|nr:DUF6520 family protein [Allomuricauda aquimarina]